MDVYRCIWFEASERKHTHAPAFIRLWRALAHSHTYAMVWHGMAYGTCARVCVCVRFVCTHRHSALKHWLTDWLTDCECATRCGCCCCQYYTVLYHAIPYCVLLCSVWALSMRNSCWHAAVAAVTVNRRACASALAEFSHNKLFWRRINQLKYRVPSRIICHRWSFFLLLLLLLLLFGNIEKHKTWLAYGCRCGGNVCVCDLTMQKTD